MDKRKNERPNFTKGDKVMVKYGIEDNHYKIFSGLELIVCNTDTYPHGNKYIVTGRRVINGRELEIEAKYLVKKESEKSKGKKHELQSS